jgi:ABC-type glycerol-3-phosphate transport system substrate-binding protein
MLKSKGLLMVFGVFAGIFLIYQTGFAFQWDKYKGTELNVMSVKQSYQTGLVKFAPDFEKKTGMKVTFDFVPWGNIRQLASVELSSKKTTYDVMFLVGADVQAYAKAGWLVSFTEMAKNTAITDEKMINLDDYFKGPVAMLSREGHVYGFPFFNATQNFYYNIDVFKAKGITKIPETLDELIEVAKKIHTKELPAISLRSAAGNYANMWTFLSAMYGLGGRLFKDYPNDMHPTIDSPENITAAKKYALLLQEYGPPGYGAILFQDNLANFQTERVAMCVEGTPLAGRILDPEKSKVIGKTGFGVVPFKGPGGLFTPGACQGYGIPSASQNQEAAWLFLQWALSSETMKKISLETTFNAPTRNSVFQDPNFIKKYDYDWGGGSFLEVFNQTNALAPSWYIPAIPEFSEIDSIVGNALNSVIVKAKSAEEAFGDAQKQVDKVMRKAGYYK